MSPGRKLVGLAASSVVLIMACSPAPSAKNPKNDPASDTAFDGMIAAERAFAKRASDTGVRDAFLAYLAPEAITFTPSPGNGRERIERRPPPPPGAPPRLSLRWAPTYGGVSAAGDMGYSTGPFVMRLADKGVDEHGLFFSVWKKQPNGEWLVVLDFGVDTPGPAEPLDAPVARAPRLTPIAPPTGHDDVADLRALDASLALGMGNTGPTTWFAPHARVLRSGVMPRVDAAAVRTFWAGFERYRTTPTFGAISASRDFGYTYGTYESSTRGVAENGHYTRVWARGDNGAWTIVADVAARAE